MRNLCILLAGALMFASCNTSYEKTKSGLRYKIYEGKGGAKLKAGEFVKFNQIALIPERDTVLFTTYGKMPGYTKIDTGAMTQYSFAEVLPMMKVGDSAIIIFSVDSLKNRGMIRDYDNAFRKGGQITFRLKVLKNYATEKEVQDDYQKDMMAEQERMRKESEVASKEEIKILDEYIKKNNIKATKTPSGAYVEIQQQGTGKTGDTSAVADVIYTGKLLKDGTPFDSNVRNGQPLQVPLGNGGMIKGFEEGLMYFGIGGKGRIFIPSFLAYGTQGSPPVIPPNATIFFEIEIKDIKPKSAMQPQHHPNDGHGH